MTTTAICNNVFALSCSPPADIGRLGMPAREFEHLVFEFAMRIVRFQGRVLYGGNLQVGGLTGQIFDHLAGAYTNGLWRRDGAARPFMHLLAVSELRQTPFERLQETLRAFGSFVEIRVVLDVDRTPLLGLAGNGLMLLPPAPERMQLVPDAAAYGGFLSTLPSTSVADALSVMRQAVERLADGRIVAGGKRGDLGVVNNADRYSGKMPGIAEEVLLSIDGGTPTAILAAYGGAARDVAIDLGILHESAKVPFLGAQQAENEQAHLRCHAVRSLIPPDNLAALAEFATREDTELLARDVVAWLAGKIGQTSNTGA